MLGSKVLSTSHSRTSTCKSSDISMSKIVVKQLFRPDNKIERALPVYEPGAKQAVSGTDTEHLVEENIDLNGYLISHPSTTFLVKVAGEQAPHLGIAPADLLVVDQAATTRDGRMVVGTVNKKFAIKFLKMKGAKLFFASDVHGGQDVEVTSSMKFNLWGAVTYIIHKPELPPPETSLAL